MVVIGIKEVPAIPANLEAAVGVHLARCGHKAAAAGMQKTCLPKALFLLVADQDETPTLLLLLLLLS